jgi:hypothetical protein
MSELDRQKVREALELLDYSTGTKQSYVGSFRDRRQDMLMQYFIDEFPASTDELRVSTSLIQKKIEESLLQSNNHPSPVDRFTSQFEDLPSDIGKKSLKTFQIGFPLNISDWPLGDEITYRQDTFECIDRTSWKAKYADAARTESRDFDEQFKKHPNEFEDEFTYWEIECDARDPEYAIKLIERELEVVLGQIIYSMLPWSHSNQFGNGNVWNRPWSELRPPFVYIVRDTSGYYDHYFDDDISPREIIQMFTDRKNQIESRYSKIPDLDPSDKIAQSLIAAFRNFHSGATEPNRRRAYLDYWRAIETLCRFGDDEMREVVPRIKSIVPYESGDSLFEDRIKEIKNKRNNYVHEQVDVEITERDNEFLRQTFYRVVPFFISNRNLEVSQLIVWMENGNKSVEEIEEALKRKNQKLSTLEAIRDSKQKDTNREW